MKKTFIEWIAYILLFIWQILQNIVGMIFWVVLKIGGSVKKIEGTKWSTAFKANKMNGGISLGSFCFLSEYGSENEALVAHELKGHTWHSRLLGPLYLFIVGIPSLLNAWLGIAKHYYDFFTEKWANKRAGLIVNELGKLVFKDAAEESVTNKEEIEKTEEEIKQEKPIEEEKVPENRIEDPVVYVNVIRDWKNEKEKTEPKVEPEKDELLKRIDMLKNKINKLKN